MELLNVLLVDDESEFRATLEKRLKKRELNVNGAESGEEALDLLNQQPFDVVVLDVRMTGMDGIEALKEIKRRYPLVEVIMLTGHAEVEVAMQGMELGAFDYLMKPMDIDNLHYKIQDAYKKKKIQEKKIKELEKIKDL